MSPETLYSLLFEFWHPEMLLGPLLLFSTCNTEDFIAGAFLCVIFSSLILMGLLRPGWWSMPLLAFVALAWPVIGKLIAGRSC
jgi:hypothetical protein